MNPEYTSAKELVELGQLSNAMAILGFTTEIIEKSDNNPLNALVGKSTSSEGSFVQSVSCCFLPVDEADLQEIQLLQIYSDLTAPIDDDIRGDMSEILNAINNKTALGYFGINEDGQVFQRYVYSKGKFDLIEGDRMVEILTLFLFIQNSFLQIILLRSSGEISKQVALNRISEV